MSVERERRNEPNNASNIFSTLNQSDRLKELVIEGEELRIKFDNAKGDFYDKIGHECDRNMDDFLEIFLDLALKPIETEEEFEALSYGVLNILGDTRDTDVDTVEKAIDDALERAIANAGTPYETGALALVRHRIESQRRQIANA